jgi:predicted O-methyltransferase YrrM
MFTDFTGAIDGWVSPYELRYLYCVATLDGDLPGGVLEVGCYQGLSTSALMQANNGNVVVVDQFTMATPSGVPHREAFEKNVTMVLNECQLEGAPTVLEMPSAQFFSTWAHWHGSFRLAFIDADHSYLGESADLRSASRLLCAGGTLVFDDCNQLEVAAAANDTIPGWRSVDGKFGVWTKGGSFA